jgi:acyl-CoA synthetase (AMP-forming)/AMP-acid ligase II
LCSSHLTAECIELARQGTVQSESPILVLSNEPEEAISSSEQMTEQLANYKVPELLVAVDAVPRNPLGETDRQALAEVVLGVPAHRHLE